MRVLQLALVLLWLQQGGRFTWMLGCVKVLCSAAALLKVDVARYKQRVLQLAFVACSLSKFIRCSLIASCVLGAKF